mgnify:FL=1
MNRRNFLRNTSLAGLSASAIVTSSFTSLEDEKNIAPANGLIQDEFQLNEITIEELQNLMQTGKQTSKSITQLYLKRIVDLNKKGPSLNAVIEVNPDAIKIAEALDIERKQGMLRGPLHGIPVLIKDNIDTADKMMTTAGAAAMIGNIAKEDAFIVKQLRSAGAVLLGKRDSEKQDLLQQNDVQENA